MRRLKRNQVFAWELQVGDKIAEWTPNAIYYGVITSDPVEKSPQYYVVDVEWEIERLFSAIGHSKSAPKLGPYLYYEDIGAP